MRVEIHGNGLAVTDSISGWIQRSLLAALHPHEPHVGRVQVRLRDLNGPHGGDDMECDVIVYLQGKRVVVVREHDADLYAAISVAAARLKNAVSRRLDRGRRRRRPALQFGNGLT